MALPVTITGPTANAGFAGPFKSAGGNYYFIGRQIGNRLVMYKATDPTTSWSVVGITLNVANTGSSGAIGGIDAVQDGDTLHVLSCFQDATITTSTRIHYHKYDLASETWTLSNEAVDGPTVANATGGGGNIRAASIVRRSASVVIAFQMTAATVMTSTYLRVGYRERPDATGVWSAAVALDALGTSATDAKHIGAVKDAQSNRIHFYWVEGTTFRARTLSAANALNTASTTTTAAITSTLFRPFNGTSYVSGGISKVVISRDLAWTGGVRFDSADNPTVSTQTGSPPNAAMIFFRNYGDDGKAYVLYAETTSQKVLIATSTDHGASWGTPVETYAGPVIAASASFCLNGGAVYVRGSNYVLPYVFGDAAAGTVRYNEYVLRAAGAAALNVSGAQTTFATTQSAAIDVDLQANAAQTTLATTQSGTISAQAALAVTGAQTLSATTQSATVGVRLAVTTGTQTTSAVTQSVAADVDAKVVGAQTTLAATQSAAADVDLKVTGAQALQAATQTGMIGAQVARVVTGAQTLLSPAQSLLADVDLRATAEQVLSPPTSTGTIGSAVLTKTWIKHAGVWKQATPYVKHAGVWKAATVHVKQAGTWKRA